jgi:hypothetical protein
MARPKLDSTVDPADPRPGPATVMAKPRRPVRRAGLRTARWVGWLFVLPALVVYAAVVLWSIFLTFEYSLYRWDGIGPSTWAGLDNYAKVFTYPDLAGSIVHAFILIVFFSAIPVLLGLAIAATIRGIATSRLALTARTVLFLPQVIPLVAAGITWSWLLASTGLVNQLLSHIGFGHVSRAWLGDVSTALPAAAPGLPAHTLEQLVDLRVAELPAPVRRVRPTEVVDPAEALLPRLAVVEDHVGVQLLPVPPKARREPYLVDAERPQPPAGRDHRFTHGALPK